MLPKFFIGPMTKNVVDGVIEFSNEKKLPIGLIPSRRQVDLNGGYVNSWSTEEFCSYVRKNSSLVLLERDHAGPSQGFNDDDGYESLENDCGHFDIIHIDPWKKFSVFEEGLESTVRLIKFCHSINSNIRYEVGTEQSIRSFDDKELELMLSILQSELKAVFEKILFVVIQSGTSLKGNEQTGRYDTERLKSMLDVSEKFGVKSKEHNGDYIDSDLIKNKMALGLHSINIAPEFGLIETQAYLDRMDKGSFEVFWRLCYESGRWKKWVGPEFNPELQKMNLVKICGHYLISDEKFSHHFRNINVSEVTKSEVKRKLSVLHEGVIDGKFY